MRKAIAWVCFVLMLCTVLPAFAQEAALDPIQAGPTQVQRGTSLSVATPNAMSGQFATEMWGSNTADMDVRALLHGYETVSWTRNVGLGVNNTAVKEVKAEQAADGSVIYTLTFADGLVYNDGTKITAKDYAFYFLLSGAPEIDAIGGTTQGLSHIVGYDDYRSGQTKTLEGVRLVSDTVLQVTIDGAYYPYFYGVTLVSAWPYPISVIAPGCEVKDDGQGVYIAGSFTADGLRQTMLDPATGYVYNPKVTSGAYSLESYDSSTNTATLVVNERFLGNYEGQKPVIERLTFTYAKEADAPALLESGSVGLMNKLGEGAQMSQWIQEQAQAGNTLPLAQANYLRTGFAFLAYACEESPTDSEAVRRAIAMSIDREALIADGLSNYGQPVYGYYGLGQWMALYADDGVASGKPALDVQEELAQYALPVDLAAAGALLEADGWTLNAQGQAFTPGTDTVRYKQVGGSLVPLEIRCALTEDNPVGEALRPLLEQTLPALGIDLSFHEMDLGMLLSHYYRQTDRTYNMFFMASNFTFVFDPYYTFHTADEFQGIINTSGLKDEELMQLARDMRETDASDLRSYVDKWLLFQARFAEVMPVAPLYSNVYQDVYTEKLLGYDITRSSSWAQAILYAWIAE